jgi:hypothetical protein
MINGFLADGQLAVQERAGAFAISTRVSIVQDLNLAQERVQQA